MSISILERLKAIMPEDKIAVHENMSKHTTFRIGGEADLFVSPTLSELPEVLRLAREFDIPVTIIGNGSNILVGDGGIRGLVISLGRPAEKIEMDGNCMILGAGTLLSKAAKEAAEHGLSGLEFAAGIPGSVGGAIVMNAGAYGGEMKDVVISATVLTKEGEVLVLSLEELELSYRHSCILEKGYIVLEIVVELLAKDKKLILDEMTDYKNRRLDKQPLEYPSAGSTFKRPEGYFAGKLIQDAGLKGYTVGGAQVSEKHSGFVINVGNATAEDVRNLISDVQERVYAQFHVKLEPEVRMMGEFN